MSLHFQPYVDAFHVNIKPVTNDMVLIVETSFPILVFLFNGCLDDAIDHVRGVPRTEHLRVVNAHFEEAGLEQ